MHPSGPPLEIPPETRNQHIYIAGATRHGKSTLMERLIIQDMELGRGLCFLDPKGDLARRLLYRIPPKRFKDAIYFDIANPTPIDFMGWETEGDRERIAADLVDIFMSFATMTAGDQWQAVLEAIVHTLLAAKGCCFLDINDALINKEYRDRIIDRVRINNSHGKYDNILAYWDYEFPNLKIDSPQPVVTRMKKFMFSGAMSKILGSPNAELNIARCMNTRKILICNLGRSAKHHTHMVGKLLVAKIWQAAFQRVDQPEDERVPFFLYADEFQNFQTSSFDEILSEAGGLKLCLTLANQGFFQLDKQILESVFANVTAARIAFHISHKDVVNWKHLVGEYYEAEELANLPKHTAFYKIGDRPPVIKRTPPPVHDPTPEQIKNAEELQKRAVDNNASIPRRNFSYSKKDDDKPNAAATGAAAPQGRVDLLRHRPQNKPPHKPR